MKELKFYNTAHPLAEGGRPIFIPFGEWDYDGTRRQRLDREHGELHHRHEGLQGAERPPREH